MRFFKKPKIMVSAWGKNAHEKSDGSRMRASVIRNGKCLAKIGGVEKILSYSKKVKVVPGPLFLFF